MKSRLDKELKAYEKQLPKLLERHRGQYVVIHSGQVAGFFKTYAQAVRYGYKRFDLSPFLVQQVREFEQAAFVSTGPCST